MAARIVDLTTTARHLTLVIYALQLAVLLAAPMPLLGVLVNHLKRADVARTIYASHFDWQIRTFWWSLVWAFAGLLLVPLFGVGLVVWVVAGVWFLYRAVRGILAWHNHEPMPTRVQHRAPAREGFGNHG